MGSERSSLLRNQTKSFFSELDKLIVERGLTKAEIQSVLEKKLSSRSAVEAFKLKFSLLNSSTSLEGLIQVIKESSSEMYSQGVSWNGRYWIPTAVVVLVIVGIIGYSIWWDNNHECVEYGTQYICRTYNNCSNTTYSTNCYSSYTVCGNEEVCTEYVRK